MLLPGADAAPADASLMARAQSGGEVGHVTVRSCEHAAHERVHFQSNGNHATCLLDQSIVVRQQSTRMKKSPVMFLSTKPENKMIMYMRPLTNEKVVTHAPNNCSLSVSHPSLTLPHTRPPAPPYNGSQSHVSVFHPPVCPQPPGPRGVAPLPHAAWPGMPPHAPAHSRFVYFY